MEQIAALNKCLGKVGTFKTEELERILAHCTFKQAKKNDYLLQPGEICNSISFILQGACYEYLRDGNGERIIELYSDFDCVVNPSSFFFQKPAEENIKAYSDCKLLTLTD